MGLSFKLSEDVKKWLARQARHAIYSSLFGIQTEIPAPSAGISEEDKAVLARKLGSFVTLTLRRQLRGCIGSIIGREPLYLNVWHMAQAAAFQDPRFPPLRQTEWPDCAVDISVLDEPSLCPSVDDIEIGKHGLILQYAGHSGVFLPQVPVEQGWDKQNYLEHLCAKAGVPAGSWQKEGARIFWYEASVFAA